MIQIAVLGYGTVGSGVVEVINRNQVIRKIFQLKEQKKTNTEIAKILEE